MVAVWSGSIDDGYNGMLGWYWGASALGTIVLLGETPHNNDRPGCDLAPVIERELTVVGARCGSLGEGVEMLRSGTVERIHSQEASLDKVFTNVTGHRLDQVEPVAAQ